MHGSIIERFLRERREAVESFDVEHFKKFVLKWQELGFYEKRPLPSDQVCEITIYKMAVNMEDVSERSQKKARAWLKLNGYDEEIYYPEGG